MLHGMQQICDLLQATEHAISTLILARLQWLFSTIKTFSVYCLPFTARASTAMTGV